MQWIRNAARQNPIFTWIRPAVPPHEHSRRSATIQRGKLPAERKSILFIRKMFTFFSAGLFFKGY